MGFSRPEYGVGCHALLQGVFPIQGSNLHFLCLLRCRWVLYPWAIMEAQNRDSPGQSRMTGHQQAGCLAWGQRLVGGGSCVLSVRVGRATCRGCVQRVCARWAWSQTEENWRTGNLLWGIGSHSRSLRAVGLFLRDLGIPVLESPWAPSRPALWRPRYFASRSSPTGLPGARFPPPGCCQHLLKPSAEKI